MYNQSLGRPSGFGGLKSLQPAPEPTTVYGKLRYYISTYISDPKTIKLLQHTVMFLGSVVLIHKYGHILDQPLPSGAELHDMLFPRQSVPPQFQAPQTQQGY
jgi:hypothetical protein